MKHDHDSSDPARHIKLLVLDLDGVLTDGGLYIDNNGHVSKRFHVQDGLGIKILQKMGIHVAIVTGLASGAARARAEQLGIVDYSEGKHKKNLVVDEFRRKYELSWAEVAYVGDDWVDLGPMGLVGFPIAVANAQPEVKAAAAWVTQTPGGAGAVREVARRILTARNLMEDALVSWTDMSKPETVAENTEDAQ